MSRILVDELPASCSECPLQGYVYPEAHPEHNRWFRCPIVETFPKCLERFVEAGEVVNGEEKEAVSG